MSQLTPRRNDASSKQPKSCLRSCQTPNYLIKSSKFHPQSNNLIVITPEVEPKRANKLDSWKTHIDFDSISPDPTKRTALEESRKGCLTKCSKATPLRSIENLDGSLKKNVSFGCVDELSHVGKAIRRSSRISGKKDADGEKCKIYEKESVGHGSGRRPSLRSAMGKENVFEKLNFSEDECKKETRRSARLNRKNNAKSVDGCKSSECKSKKPRRKQNANANEQSDKALIVFECRTETRRSQRLMNSKKVVEYTENAITGKMDAGNHNVYSDLSVSKDNNVSDVLSDNSKKDVGIEKSKKRKREIIRRGEISSETTKKGQHCGLKDWSEEQDFALQKAYLIANPSPHFWKKVARMVSGKSAQECFDRVNNSLVTPPPQQPRPRANNKTYSISPITTFSLSDSKPASHPNTTVRKVSSKKKSLVAQKKVRHLLRKHSKDDQAQEADYFSLLGTSPVRLAMSSPEATNSAIFSPNKTSSSSHNKRLSRFSKSNEPSPVVLKKVKNVALHERYIDQLHSREARRKYVAGNSRAVKREVVDDKSAVVKAAKSALIADATDVIIQFKQSRVEVEDVDDDDDIDGDDDEEDE